MNELKWKKKHCIGIIPYKLRSIILKVSCYVVYSLQPCTVQTVNVYTKYGAHAVSDYDSAASFFLVPPSSSLFGTFQIRVDFLKKLYRHRVWWSPWSLWSINYKMFSTQLGRMPYSFPRSSLLGPRARAKGKHKTVKC